MKETGKHWSTVGDGGGIERRKESTPRVGVFGVGYFKYWPQFEGLLEALLEKQRVFIGKLEKNQVEIVDFGLVDDATTGVVSNPGSMTSIVGPLTMPTPR